ncbi:MAG: hypothetical protein VXZ91_00390 [Pseudomonadota bacterium]|nr:hypothetical protein [Pseudomonadota bacterium]
MSKTSVKRGRPAGIRARQLDLKRTLLDHPDVPTVIETEVRTALDDNHKNQTVAQKILMDRNLPISTFDKQFDNREKITINVSVIGKESETLEGEVIEQ